MSAPKLTGKRREMIVAIAKARGGIFHRTTVEALERDGLIVDVTNGIRLVGCNGFSATRFQLTPLGREALKGAGHG